MEIFRQDGLSFFSVSLNLSTPPFACGWDRAVLMCLIPFPPTKEVKSDENDWGPLTVVMVSSAGHRPPGGITGGGEHHGVPRRCPPGCETMEQLAMKVAATVVVAQSLPCSW